MEINKQIHITLSVKDVAYFTSALLHYADKCEKTGKGKELVRYFRHKANELGNNLYNTKTEDYTKK